ncbi:hypothetical protein EV178_000444 [Coemansia sp. RSA 1646]|nr:hypothetical protein EV178_000444 [Coemansia sp. RSA 1646]KAJ2093748.1 hypothetical protein IW138_000144 [Coemansia sp. RSA 986]
MNVWMNDSLLNSGVFPATSDLGKGSVQGNNGSASAFTAAQLPVSFSPSTLEALASESPATITDAGPTAQQLLPSYITHNQMPNPYDPNALIPMDFALGLPAFNSQLGVDANNTLSSNNEPSSSALASFSPMTEIAALQARSSPLTSFVLGLQPDFLQQLNPLRQAQIGTATWTPTYSNSTTHSPLNMSSPNPLVSSAADVSHTANFPTSAFASLNLVNSLELPPSPQNANAALREPMPGNSMATILANSALSRIPAGITNSSSSASTSATSALPVSGSVLAGMMQPVPNALSSAATLGSTMLPLQQLSALGGTNQAMFPRHNSVPMAQGCQASLDVSSSADVRHVTAATSQPIFSSSIVSKPGNASLIATLQQSASSLNIQIPCSDRVNNISFANSLLSSSSLGNTTPNLKDTISPERQEELHKKRLIYGTQTSSGPRVTNSAGGKEHSVTAPSLNAGSTTLIDGSSNSVTSSPHQSKESASGSPAVGTLSSTIANVGQMNKAIIPQMLRDAVDEHPELGCAELIYNLLIIHVVHDCSRIGIYQAHIFWMRVREYKLPKFHLYASIADASRSWSLPDELRAALPPNLDEICYALSIEVAPTDDSDLQIINAIGLLILASYEFKSARFAPMVEHNCLAYKIIVQVKFRGAPFPWRAAKKHPDESGVDSNYEALLRAFWRLSLSLYYATEIFRIDAPEDRDFLPEMPTGDDYFVQRVFVVDPAGEFGFKAVKPSYEVSDTGIGDMFSIISELFIKQYKIANRFNRVQRGEKTGDWYINYLLEWDRQMLEWREGLPQYLHGDLAALARQTQPLDARRRRMNLWGLSEDGMWQKRHQWNQDVGRTMEVLYVHMVFEMARIKAHRIGLMLLMREDLDMLRNFQNSKVFTVQELPPMPHMPPITLSHEEDAERFSHFSKQASDAASHLYDMLKFSYQFGFDLHAYSTIIISTLLQVGLVYVGQVQSSDTRLAWCAMLRLARILGMIRSLERWAPALYIFTNILKALGRPELILHPPSPETRAQLLADTRRPAAFADRAMSIDSSTTADTNNMEVCDDSTQHTPAGEDESDHAHSSSTGKRKSSSTDVHGDEKRYEFSDHHHGDPHSVSSISSSPASEEEDVTNPFPPDHVISHIMHEQKVSTATFFSPTLPILAASLLHNNIP